MPPYGKQRTVERSIYLDSGGYEVVARVGRFKQSKRWPADTNIRTLRAWRDLTVSDMRQEKTPTTDTSTLAGSIKKFRQLVKVDAPVSAALHAWEARHGKMLRRKLTPTLASQAIEHWKGEGLSPQTLFYRRLVLEKLWKTLDGPKAHTPVEDIHISRPKGRRPVWVSDETINAVLASLELHEKSGKRTEANPQTGRLRNAKARARFMVLASTGQRPAQMKRAKRGDVDLDAKVWWVREAKGGDPTAVYLTDDMIAAWKVFIEAKAWGAYDKRNFARTLRRNGWPDGIRPYNLRHATGLTLSESGVDLRDISSHMGHQSMTTTARFYVPQLHSRLKALGATLEGRFGWGPQETKNMLSELTWTCPAGHSCARPVQTSEELSRLRTEAEAGTIQWFCIQCYRTYTLNPADAANVRKVLADPDAS